ncbi:MAG TPA: cupin domain-containing protein [Bacteroidetes bacterium]|nr:cupin domain-containing protein [Bacteroidota bacterium]
MIIKKGDSQPFIAADLTFLKEILHPKNVEAELSFSLAQASLGVGEASLPHVLDQSETYYFLSGNGRLHIGEKSFGAEKGDTIYVAPGKTQHLVNTGKAPLEFLCIVSPPWSAEGESVF